MEKPISQDRGKKSMDQKQTPIIDMLEKFYHRNPAYFNIPGHRFEKGIDPGLLKLLGKNLFRADVTETDGTDDLHAATGPILKAERLAAELYGTEQCSFLVNGTTCANEAMILAAVNPGEKILVPRNAHKSVYMGLILSGAKPVWIMPEHLSESEIFGRVSPEKVRQMLIQDAGIRAVFLVSPTYYGIASDVRKIAEICHAFDLPLLVDEAHGAHFHFHAKFPEGAEETGADLIAQSTHKTLGSLTQSSMLHRNGNRIREERLYDSLKLVQSTSPSYILMAALDGARHQMAMQGEELWDQAINLSERIRKELAVIPGISLLENDDPCRVVFSCRDTGGEQISGYEMQEYLFQKDVTTEMADENYVVAVIVPANTEADADRLIEAVQGFTQQPPVQRKKRQKEMMLRELPEQVFLPRETYYQKKKSVPLEKAAGQIAGEMIAPYPPGIPVIYPGEKISEKIREDLIFCRNRGVSIHGAADPLLRSIRVCDKGR
jgi:arginine decarboxylase